MPYDTIDFDRGIGPLIVYLRLIDTGMHWIHCLGEVTTPEILVLDNPSNYSQHVSSILSFGFILDSQRTRAYVNYFVP